MHTDIPSNIVCREAEFTRIYRSEDHTVRSEVVTGLDFGLDFPHFAVFKDPSQFKSEYIIIHRPSGRSLGKCFSLGPIVQFLREVYGKVNWAMKDGYKRKTVFFTEIAQSARRCGVVDL
jgi:hypothetical protein